MSHGIDYLGHYGPLQGTFGLLMLSLIPVTKPQAPLGSSSHSRNGSSLPQFLKHCCRKESHYFGVLDSNFGLPGLVLWRSRKIEGMNSQLASEAPDFLSLSHFPPGLILLVLQAHLQAIAQDLLSLFQRQWLPKQVISLRNLLTCLVFLLSFPFGDFSSLIPSISVESPDVISM